MGDRPEVALLSDDEDELVHESSEVCEEELEFDNAMDALQDVLMDESFSSTQRRFLDEYCAEFEDAEENKLVYMDIFVKYVTCMESCIEGMLKDRIPDFSAERFAKLALARPQDELVGDAIDLLLSLQEFSEFKSLMLSHKAGANIDASLALHVNAPCVS